MGIRLHYNSDCPVCVRQAARTASMDWLGRVELCTDASPLAGPDRQGCNGDACEI